ncbi:MAG: hypothetical protein NW237_10925 [Cyanobacteriota bacterium]|nr:hypothetical protein [Cyanobacteriota bacterium]
MNKDAGTVFQEDVKVGLMTWVVLEAACFWGIPLTKAYPYEDVSNWLIPSLFMGPIGALIVAGSSAWIVANQLLADAKKKDFRRRVAQGISLLGFLGIAFPLLLAGVVFARALQETDWKNILPNATPTPYIKPSPRP